MTGAHTVTLIGKFDTIEETVASWNTQTTTALTDEIKLFIEPGIGPARFDLVKVTVAA